ncbi:hypothetical protein [Enorma phocaeensis]|uniref:hypothetical protein n=1 Tax=Enorma phocaeensis TaxID=1871019 RepID=UPI0015E0AE63|nr:hypothetical protein [Enorma phocaeensis]
MSLLGILIASPLLVAVALLAFRTDRARDAIVVLSAAVIGIASVCVAVAFLA